LSNLTLKKCTYSNRCLLLCRAVGNKSATDMNTPSDLEMDTFCLAQLMVLRSVLGFLKEPHTWIAIATQVREE
jgi:hypothetical protein